MTAVVENRRRGLEESQISIWKPARGSEKGVRAASPYVSSLPPKDPSNCFANQEGYRYCVYWINAFGTAVGWLFRDQQVLVPDARMSSNSCQRVKSHRVGFGCCTSREVDGSGAMWWGGRVRMDGEVIPDNKQLIMAQVLIRSSRRYYCEWDGEGNSIVLNRWLLLYCGFNFRMTLGRSASCRSHYNQSRAISWR